MGTMNTAHHSLFGAPVNLTSRERQAFDWQSFITAAAQRDSAKLGFVSEVSSEIERRIGRSVSGPNTWFLPPDLLTRDATAANTGALVGVSAPSFIETFRGTSLIGTLPLRVLPGLVGDVTLPRMQSVTAGWFAAEGAQATDAAPVLGQISMSPKTAAAYVLLSQQFRRQTAGAASAFIETELARALGAEVGRALLAGGGASGEPASPFLAPGVATESGASFTWAKALNMLSGCESVGDAGAVRWVAGASAAKVLRQRERASGSGFVLDDSQIAGHQCLVTSAAPASALYCANWDAVSVAVWSGLEIAVSPFGTSSSDFARGCIAVRVTAMVDFAALHPGALAYTTGTLS